MTEHHLSLATVYKGWEGYQSHLARVITPLSSEQLSLRAGPQLRTPVSK